MPWNGPIDGDWSTVDYNAAPWNNTVCNLTHDEVVFTKDACERIQEDNPGIDSMMIISTFDNESNWERPINGVTYDLIIVYNPEINKLGIEQYEDEFGNSFGRIIPEPISEEEQVTEGE